MGLIKNYNKDSDITLMNTIYLYPRKKDDDKWDNGSMTLIYKDNKTGFKHHETIDNPNYEFYSLKPEFKLDHNEIYYDKDKLDHHVVPYKDLMKEIADITGNKEFYYNNIRNGNRKENNKLHTHTDLFMSDQNIEDHYRYLFSKQYPNNIEEISKGYLDIEVDTIDMRGDFPELGECPINAVTIIDEKRKNSYTFLLRNKENPLIEEFEKSINADFFVELQDFIRNKVGGRKNEIKFGLDDFKFNLLFYDEEDEIKLIKDVFNCINKLQIDFILAWNMAFDIPYIIERIKVLGYRPEDIMCHPDFEKKVARYYIDEMNSDKYEERGDFATISSYSIFLDQLIHFRSRRKGQSMFTSFKLDYVGKVIANVTKADYSHITTQIAKLPYMDYKVFTIYNIFDTIVQKCIENKTGDIDYIFSKCIMNNTRYQKGHRQTVYLTNRGAVEFEEECNMIIGNNTNRFNKKEGKFPGAWVANPLQLSDYSKMRINGIPVLIFDNLDDYDFTSLYPSLIREFNIAPNTQIGMIEIINKIHDKENRTNDDRYSRGGAFLTDLQSQVYLLFCHRWLKFGNYKELYHDIEEYFTNHKTPSNNLRWCNSKGLIIPSHIYNESIEKTAVRFDQEDTLRKAVSFYKIPQLDKLKGVNNNGSVS